MKVQMQLIVTGAQYYDITDEKTGEVKRYTSIFVLNELDLGKPDRSGFQGGKLRGATSDLVEKVRAMKLPATVNVEADMTTNAKGEVRIVVHRFVDSAVLSKAA